MARGKQAKVLSETQQRAVLSFLDTTRYPIRNRAIFLLSAKAGLRAKEIAALTWNAVCDAEGNLGGSIELTDKASKGRSGRSIPLNRQLAAGVPNGIRTRVTAVKETQHDASERWWTTSFLCAAAILSNIGLARPHSF